MHSAGNDKNRTERGKGERGTLVQGRSVIGEVITDDLETPFTVGAAVYL